MFFFFSSRRRHRRFKCDWSSDVCSSDLTGMLYSAEIIRTVCDVMESLPSKSRPCLVVDPVMVASSEDLLLGPDPLALYRDRLVPLPTIVRPNLHDAITLSHRALQTIEEL